MSSENTQLLRKGRKERPGEQRPLLEKKQGIPTAPANRPSPNLCEASQGRSFYSPLTLSGSERLHQPSPQPSPNPHSGYSGSSIPCQEASSGPCTLEKPFPLDWMQSPLTASLLSDSSLCYSPWLLGPSAPWQHNTQDPMVCWHWTYLRSSHLHSVTAGACLYFGFTQSLLMRGSRDDHQVWSGAQLKVSLEHLCCFAWHCSGRLLPIVGEVWGTRHKTTPPQERSYSGA